MKKFAVLYTAPQSVPDQISQSTPEEVQEAIKAWMEWEERVGTGIVDSGNPFGEGKEITATGTSSVGNTNRASGYGIIQAEDMAGAQALLDGHPHLLSSGSGIQVYEFVDLPSNGAP